MGPTSILKGPKKIASDWGSGSRWTSHELEDTGAPLGRPAGGCRRAMRDVGESGAVSAEPEDWLPVLCSSSSSTAGGEGRATGSGLGIVSQAATVSSRSETKLYRKMFKLGRQHGQHKTAEKMWGPMYFDLNPVASIS